MSVIASIQGRGMSPIPRGVGGRWQWSPRGSVRSCWLRGLCAKGRRRSGGLLWRMRSGCWPSLRSAASLRD